MNQQEAQQAEQSQPKQGPGDQLQTARISIGLTLEEVARKMHLSTGILSSLEENNFEDITAPIFVKGYLRAYSRLVNVNEDDIIQQYATFYMGGDPPISSTSNTSPEINANDSAVKWVTYLIIIGLIALLSIWWWNRYQQEPEKVSLESGNQPPTDVIALNPSVESSLPVPNSETTVLDADKDSLQLEIKTVVDSLQQPAEETESVTLETGTLADGLAVTPAGLSEQTAELETAITEEVSTVTPDAVISDRVIADEDTVDENEPLVIASDNDQNLVITVNADTWASIKDATGKKLVYDLLRTGEIISVTGEAPFRAFLGNGYGVSMTYKGKEVDLSSVIQPDNTARIKIEQ